MRVLVLGGSGFIGSHLVDALLDQGKSVRVFDRSPERYRPLPSGVDFIQGNFEDSTLLAEALTDVDQVFHMISTTIPATSNLDPVSDVQGNLINTIRLLELMRAESVRRLIYLSSGGMVYGIPQSNFLRENHQLKPITSYGIVKVAIENYLHMEKHLYGLEPVILRASNPYGSRQGHSGAQGVIGTFMWKLVNGEPIQIWGDGSIVRDFIYVRDLARLCVISADSEITGCYNAGSGIGHSIAEIVDAIQEVTGKNITPIIKPGRLIDVPHVVLDISAITDATSWYPKVNLSDGLKETWEWVQTQKI